MKIAFIRESEIKELNPDIIETKALGATESCFIHLAQKLSLYHQVKVFCPCSEQKTYIKDNAVVEFIPLSTELNLSLYVHGFSPDIIIVVANPNYLFCPFLRDFKKIFWQQNHPLELDKNQRFVHEASFIENRPFTIVMSSHEAKKYAQNHYQNPYIHGIYNGVRDAFFERLSVEKIKNKIIFVGSLVPAKGILELLKAINTLNQYEFNICGSFDMYGYSIPIYKDACNMYKGSHIKYLGGLSAKELIYHMASAELCIVNPIVGNLETCCVSALESMSVGTPVIAGGKSIIESIITHGGLIHKGNLVDIINKLMENPEKRKELSESGKRWTQQNVSYDKIIPQWLSFLDKIIHND